MPWWQPGTGWSLCRRAPAAERPRPTSRTALQLDVAVRAVPTEFGRRRPVRVAGGRCGSTPWDRAGPSAAPATANTRPRNVDSADAYVVHAGVCLTAVSATRDAMSAPSTHVSAAEPRPLLRPSRQTAPSAGGAISSPSALAENAERFASSTSAPAGTPRTCAPPATAHLPLPAPPADGSDPVLRNGQANHSAKAAIPVLHASAFAALATAQSIPAGPWARCVRPATRRSATTPAPAISADSTVRSSASPSKATASADPAQEPISPMRASGAA